MSQVNARSFGWYQIRRMETRKRGSVSASTKNPALSVIVPVYNERATIEEIIVRIQEVDLDKEVVIIDDGSTDGTREFLAELALHAQPNPGVMTLPRNQ